MKLKKIAVRGLIGVAVLVGLCMFFSGTIENITTPKVQLAKAARGKLVQTLKLEGTLAYPQIESVRLDALGSQTATVSRVNVRAGYPVKAGDVIVEASITGYAAALEQAKAEYAEAVEALSEVERKNARVTLRRSDENYAQAYAALRAATLGAADKRGDMELALRAAGLSYVESGYPEAADEATRAAVDAYRAALDAQRAAQADFDVAARYGVDETAWTAISEKQAAQEKADDCLDKLVALEAQNRAASAICAAHDGIIASVGVQAGDNCDANAVLYTITAEGSGAVLRAELGEAQQSIAEGTQVTMSTLNRGDIDTKIVATGFSDTGARYADIAVTDEMISAQGSLYSMSQGSVELAIEFKAKESSCLLPASAVRGSGDSRYVYIVNESATTFGKTKLTISKLSVTLLAEADGTASLQDDVSYYNIAYMEDRPLREGCSVMNYLS